MFKPSVLALALVLSSTALWSAFVTGSLGVTAAMIRFLVAVPVAGAMTYAFQAVVGGYSRRANAERRRQQLAEDALGLKGGGTVR